MKRILNTQFASIGRFNENPDMYYEKYPTRLLENASFASLANVGLNKSANSVDVTDMIIVSSTFPPVTVSKIDTTNPVFGAPL